MAHKKLSKNLKNMGQQVSLRWIDRMMKKVNLISNYTVSQFKSHLAKCDEDKIENIVDRQCDEQLYFNVVVSDLNYVRVENRWHYLLVLVDLFNREIIGYSSGPNKDLQLVKKAFCIVQTNLSQIKIFRTDWRNEVKN